MTNPWDGIECDWREPPDDVALKNAVHLVKASRAAGFPPSQAATGKWLSVCLFWDGGRTEVEVFSDRFELYFLPRSSEDGAFNVEHLEANATDTLVVLVQKIRTVRTTLRE